MHKPHHAQAAMARRAQHELTDLALAAQPPLLAPSDLASMVRLLAVESLPRVPLHVSN